MSPVTRDGKVSIIFSEFTELPTLEEYVDQMYLIHNITFDSEPQPGDDLFLEMILPDYELYTSPRKDFQWFIYDIHDYQIDIQLIFTDPKYISPDKEKDKIRVTVLNRDWFANVLNIVNTTEQQDKDRRMLQVVDLESSTIVSEATLYPQVDVDRALLLKRIFNFVVVWYVLLFIVFVSFYFYNGTPLFHIWSMFYFFQLSIHTSLIYAEQMPANLEIFFSNLMPLANLKIFRAESWLANIFDFTPTYHLNIKFFEGRYDDRHAILMCSIPFVVIALASFVTLIYRYNQDNKDLKKQQIKLSKVVPHVDDLTYSRVIFNIVMVFYLQLMISAMINVQTLYSNTFADVISSLWAIFTLVALVLLPFYIHKILLPDKPGSHKLLKVGRYKNQYGVFYDHLIYRNPEKRLMHNVHILRKCIFVLSLFLSQHPIRQLSINVYASVSVLSYLVGNMPVDDDMGNAMEIFNEVCMFTIFALFFAFTEYWPTPSIVHVPEFRYNVGEAVIWIILSNLVINTVLICWQAYRTWNFQNLKTNYERKKRQMSVEINFVDQYLRRKKDHSRLEKAKWRHVGIVEPDVKVETLDSDSRIVPVQDQSQILNNIQNNKNMSVVGNDDVSDDSHIQSKINNLDAYPQPNQINTLGFNSSVKDLKISKAITSKIELQDNQKPFTTTVTGSFGQNLAKSNHFNTPIEMQNTVNSFDIVRNKKEEPIHRSTNNLKEFLQTNNNQNRDDNSTSLSSKGKKDKDLNDRESNSDTASQEDRKGQSFLDKFKTFFDRPRKTEQVKNYDHAGNINIVPTRMRNQTTLPSVHQSHDNHSKRTALINYLSSSNKPTDFQRSTNLTHSMQPAGDPYQLQQQNKAKGENVHNNSHSSFSKVHPVEMFDIEHVHQVEPLEYGNDNNQIQFNHRRDSIDRYIGTNHENQIQPVTFQMNQLPFNNESNTISNTREQPQMSQKDIENKLKRIQNQVDRLHNDDGNDIVYQ